MIIEDYIEAQREDIKPRLYQIYHLFKEVLPDAEEKISFKMPTFSIGRNIIHFAAFKKHISIFPGGEATRVFEDKLKDYKTSKGTIQIQNNQELPLSLIREIALWCKEHTPRNENEPPVSKEY